MYRDAMRMRCRLEIPTAALEHTRSIAMASAIAPSGPDAHIPLKPEDQPAQELHELEDLDFDTSRGALDKTLARLAAADRSGLEDLGYSCEWWPPSE
jgi:hypothetical protein